MMINPIIHAITSIVRAWQTIIIAPPSRHKGRKGEEEIVLIIPGLTVLDCLAFSKASHVSLQYNTEWTRNFSNNLIS